MSKNDQQQSNADAVASPSRCVQKVLDTHRRFIDDSSTTTATDTDEIFFCGLIVLRYEKKKGA